MSLSVPNLLLGVCYYPEHWQESLWEDDYRRMREMGLQVVRMGEFAWSIFEPSEGEFNFELFDRAMDAAHRHGLKVILGTPTATPPAWLTHKYPEVLNATQEGVVYRHGMRRHSNFNSPIFLKLCARIASKLAEHYANHPALFGWQIDNELNCEVNVYYADADHAAFRVWLEKRYGTLEKLNHAWGAVFWNQTYSAWEQVFLTRPTPSNSPNPHQLLDEKRFISDATIEFAKRQSNAIREHDKTHFITTNGLFGHVDSHEMTRQALDFISYDSYPLFSQLWPDPGENPLLDRNWSAMLSAVRDISSPFCVMEQQSGPGGWVNRLALPTPKPGQIRLWAYQSIAHGADMVLFFRWRTAPFGTEIYWHGINDYDNRPNRRCAEVTEIAREVRMLDRLVGSQFQADVAILRDYDNEWDGEFDTWHGPYDKQSFREWYKALQFEHIPVDTVRLQPSTMAADLAKYRCLVYPHPAILSEAQAKVLKEYVELGGYIVFGCRSGYKDSQGHCRMQPMPGPISDLCGVTVEEFTRIGTLQHEPHLVWKDNVESYGNLLSGPFTEVLRLESHNVQVVAQYAEDAGHFAGKPALTRHPWGSGVAFYFGGAFTASVVHTLIAELGLRCPIAEQVSAPREIELAIRGNSSGERFVFLLNYSEQPQGATLHRSAISAFNGELLSGYHEIPPHGVSILIFEPAPAHLEHREPTAASHF